MLLVHIILTNVILEIKVDKYIRKLGEPNKTRIVKAISKLEKEPPIGDIEQMAGATKRFRLRVGKYRILFGILDETIRVYDIGLRGQIYKHGGKS